MQCWVELSCVLFCGVCVEGFYCIIVHTKHLRPFQLQRRTYSVDKNNTLFYRLTSWKKINRFLKWFRCQNEDEFAITLDNVRANVRLDDNCLKSAYGKTSASALAGHSSYGQTSERDYAKFTTKTSNVISIAISS